MNVLITGGTGSLGTVLTHDFLQRGHHVTVLSRDPHKQDRLQKEVTDKQYLGKLTMRLGDVANLMSVIEACKGQQIVIHTAALKRVERGETDTTEYTRVNITGTQNVAMACITQSVRQGLFISSDKAVEPLNFYGETKAVGEKIWLNHDNDITFMSVLRYGNVVNSEGSVWHIWKNAVTKRQTLQLRTPEPARFALTINQAVELIRDALYVMWRANHGGQTFIPYNLPAFSVWELAYLLQPDSSQYIYEPLITGEKQHEMLLAKNEHAKPTANNQLLWQLCSNNEEPKTDYRQQFCSATARRITAAEVTAMIEG